MVKPQTKPTENVKTTEVEKLNLHQKLFEFQKLNLVIKKNAEVDMKSRKYKYAPLDQVWKVIGEKLNECWILVTHEIIREETGHFVRTTVCNVADIEESLSSEIGIDPSVIAPQNIWSAITYYRRYNLCCLLNLIIEGDDDDGEEAQKQATKKQFTQKSQAPQTSTQSQKPVKKPEFTQENFEAYKQFCKGKVMDEIMKMAAEIKEKYTITEAMADQLNLFLKSL